MLACFSAASSTAQSTRKALFLGNSYTAVNNLPQIVADVALSAGDTLNFDSYTPGGYTLEAHSIDPTTQAKIMAGGWEYVILQGQSQEPVTHSSQFYQGGSDLNDMVIQYNSCAVTMLYMTWGRKNGDAPNCSSFPVMCTYAGMDSTLRNSYLTLASGIDAEISPVSVVWNYLIQNNPSIELYQPDESHPSAAGSYAAACCFYAAIFKKDPTLITFNHTLSATDAAIIRNAAKTQVFDNLSVWDYKELPQSGFRYTTGAGVNEAVFSPLNYGVSQTYSWDFGDVSTSALINPTHSYASNGTYTVTLTTSNCDLAGMHTSVSDTVIQFCSHTPTISPSGPSLCKYDTLWTQPADSWQWFSAGSPIPEANQFLPDYQQYNSGNFSVLTTLNGCSELSQVYNANPQWSGYYFDAAWGGDPCAGDTALFIVLHVNGYLQGSEIIRWYKNSLLLPAMNNEDTLLITDEGVYECKVIDPNSACPLDTTVSSPVVFDCGTLGVENNSSNVSLSIYPNPASDFISIEFSQNIGQEELHIYNTSGQLVKVMKASRSMKLDVSTLPEGLYCIRFKNSRQPVLKFMKQ